MLKMRGADVDGVDGVLFKKKILLGFVLALN